MLSWSSCGRLAKGDDCVGRMKVFEVAIVVKREDLGNVDAGVRASENVGCVSQGCLAAAHEPCVIPKQTSVLSNTTFPPHSPGSIR